jgi:hypothetical protein
LPRLLESPKRTSRISVAARHRLPAVYPFRYFATSGGLISYGPDSSDPYRRAASYVASSRRFTSAAFFAAHLGVVGDKPPKVGGRARRLDSAK